MTPRHARRARTARAASARRSRGERKQGLQLDLATLTLFSQSAEAREWYRRHEPTAYRYWETWAAFREAA